MDWLAQLIAPLPLSFFAVIAALTLVFTTIACLPHRWVERALTLIARRLGIK